MVRADEVTLEEYRTDPAKHSFTYPTCPGNVVWICPKLYSDERFRPRCVSSRRPSSFSVAADWRNNSENLLT